MFSTIKILQVNFEDGSGVPNAVTSMVKKIRTARRPVANDIVAANDLPP
jgi:hypothetical protein